MYEDLYSRSSEEYWGSEGNNKRMRIYYKLSKSLKCIRYLMITMLAIYCVVLATNSIFCLFDNLICCKNEILILNLINFKRFVINNYIITFIIILFVGIYFGIKQKQTVKEYVLNFVRGFLFLPVSFLLVYNFVVLGSLMRSFYLVVVFVVIMILIELLTKRIDKLYDLAVGSVEVNRKGDKKVCKNCKGK